MSNHLVVSIYNLLFWALPLIVGIWIVVYVRARSKRKNDGETAPSKKGFNWLFGLVPLGVLGGLIFTGLAVSFMGTSINRPNVSFPTIGKRCSNHVEKVFQCKVSETTPERKRLGSTEFAKRAGLYKGWDVEAVCSPKESAVPIPKNQSFVRDQYTAGAQSLFSTCTYEFSCFISIARIDGRRYRVSTRKLRAIETPKLLASKNLCRDGS